MNSKPLADFIENKGFDKYQSGLVSRFKAYRLNYELVYGGTTNKSSMYLNFESASQVGRVTVWVSGECELEVFDKNIGDPVLRETHVLNSEQEFLDTYKKIPILMRDHNKSLGG